MRKVFYNCESTGDRVDSSSPREFDDDSAIGIAQQVMRADGDFFGIVDDAGTTLQFAVEEDGRVWMEIPKPSEAGSYGQHIAFSELEPTLIALNSRILVADFPDMKFVRWS